MHIKHAVRWGMLLRISTVAAAITASLVPSLAVAQDCPSPCFTGGGIMAGLGFASGIIGLLIGDPATVASGIIGRLLVFLGLVCTIVVIIAGLYLIFGLGDEGSRDKAKHIILYTAIGIFIIVFAKVIVDFVFYLAGTGATTADVDIRNIILRGLTFLGLICTVVIILAGLFLILGLGDEGSKDKAKHIILYTVVGLLIILLAQQIVDFVFYLVNQNATPALRASIALILARLLNFLALVAVIVVIIAGVFLILSMGDEGQRDKAKNTIFYTIIGLLIILLSRIIVEFVTKYLAGQI